MRAGAADFRGLVGAFHGIGESSERAGCRRRRDGQKRSSGHCAAVAPRVRTRPLAFADDGASPR
jgi:hypothetical protein